MPYVIGPDGVEQVVPGVYTEISAVQGGPGPLPTFQVPVMIADCYSGYPSDFPSNSGKLLDEANLFPFLDIGSTTAAQATFGLACDMSRMFAVAKRHGLPRAWCLGAAQMVRAKVIVNSATPTAQFNLVGKLWGFPPGWIKIKFASGIFSYQQPQKLAKITADVAAGVTRIYVDDNSWIVPGMSLEIGDNATTNSVVRVRPGARAKGVELSSTGQPLYWVELTLATSDNYALADYAAVALYKATPTASPTFSTGQSQLLIDWLNSGASPFRAQKRSTFTGALPIAISTLTPLKDISTWGTNTKGTSPAASAGDYADLVDAFNSVYWAQFLARVGNFPRVFSLGTSDATAHASWRDYAIARRLAGYSIAPVLGCAWGDVVISASDDTSPIHRAAALDSQDINLVACGADGLGSYLTLAPAVFGLLVAGGLNHNLTNDAFVGFSTFETTWDEDGLGQVSALCRAGVITYRQVFLNGAVQPVVTQGLSTLQANDQIWFEVDGTGFTWARQQRDLADYVDRVLKIEFINKVVGQEVDVDFVRAAMVARAQQLVGAGIVVRFDFVSVTRNDTGNGFVFTWAPLLPGLTDYVTGTTFIQYE